MLNGLKNVTVLFVSVDSSTFLKNSINTKLRDLIASYPLVKAMDPHIFDRIHGSDFEKNWIQILQSARDPMESGSKTLQQRLQKGARKESLEACRKTLWGKLARGNRYTNTAISGHCARLPSQD